MKTIYNKGLTARLSFGFVALTMLFSAYVAQPASALTTAETIRCNSIMKYATEGIGSLNIKSAAMQSTFKLNLTYLQDGWDLNDTATGGTRSTGQAEFTSILATFQAKPDATEAQKKALAKYKVDILAGINIRNNEIDSIKAIYRENILATIKTHQQELTDAASEFKASISKAINVAKTNCADAGVASTLVGQIKIAKLQLNKLARASDIKAMHSATNIALQRTNDATETNQMFRTLGKQVTETLSVAYKTEK